MATVAIDDEPVQLNDSGCFRAEIDEGETMLVVSVHRTFVVRCGVCSARFAGWDEACRTQASGCAAVYKDGKIEGFYGSRVADMTVFDVAEELRVQLAPRIDPVCDGCITGWVDAGLAREHGEVRLDHGPDEPAEVIQHPRGHA